MLTVSSFHDDDDDDDHYEKDCNGDTQTDIHSNILIVLRFMGFWKEKNKRSGASCSKLTMLLVNDSLKFQT